LQNFRRIARTIFDVIFDAVGKSFGDAWHNKLTAQNRLFFLQMLSRFVNH
jgi:NADPH-dependent curcumin reductase CurA